MRALQRYLDRTGYETDVDGEFGRGTRTSVMSFEWAETGRGTRLSRGEQRLRKRAAGTDSTETDASGEGGAGYEEGAPPGHRGARRGGLHRRRRSGRPPASAPQEVKDIIAAGNKIARKPYKYGGGHGRWRDSGYDCSGSISYVLHAAGLLDAPLASGGFTSWGERGRGEWLTVRANAGHAYLIVAGLRFDTSARKVTGNRWSEEMRSARGYAGRHPEGL